MKKEHLKSNMNMVRQEVESMLDSIEGVKGLRYRKYVETLLLASQVLEASMLALSHINDDPVLKTSLRRAIQQNMSGILSLYHELSGFSEGDMEELLKAGDTLVANFKSVAMTAIQASREGYSIEGEGQV